MNCYPVHSLEGAGRGASSMAIERPTLYASVDSEHCINISCHDNSELLCADVIVTNTIV